MGKGKIVGKIAAKAVQSLAPDLAVTAAAGAANIFKNTYDKHQAYVKVPDVSGLSIEDIPPILQKAKFNFASVLAEPDKRYAEKRPNTVLRTAPHANASVPPETFIKVFYADEDVINASKALAAEASEKKAARNEAAKQLAHKVEDTAKTTTVGLAHKLNPKKLLKKKQAQLIRLLTRKTKIRNTTLTGNPPTSKI
ncbi:PASTA domain-containing protein [Lacticaseibacillus camelliae]|uniref:PASTA domain-containing protein n=1 Tax=Lacticaseibacillus camelliae DSM 22697 = JCM 13995 TaxID=1423730 RepID=A0A0R2FLZ4_9LACO|nr:PASTA domain-containing protein [Lacticaseibacillus camelliae]KRN25898.1 hypothetical protein FC75_GL002032 [Lacticaseibacillus camelliae DSM 22697 = JCM 13995]